MKVVIVEDEKLSAEHLSLFLSKIDPEIEVVQYLDTVKATIDFFGQGIHVDLLFLDIHLADGNSFEIFSKVRIDIPIIFTSAYDQYAIQAFKQNSIDYLLKPISLADLRTALEKLKKQRQLMDARLFESITTMMQQTNLHYKSRFLVKIGQSIHPVQTEDIHHFETQESNTLLVTNKKNRYPVDFTIAQLETILHPNDFFRINRKIIIHIKSIESIESYYNGRLSIKSRCLEGDSKIVSRERVNDFKKWLGT